MAQRFGGKYSPDGAPDSTSDTASGSPAPNRFRGLRAQRPNFRSRLLFLAPLPLLFSAIGELRAAFASLILGAWLLRDGILAEEAYRSRKIARPPALPRKLLAAEFAGLGVAVAAYFGWQQGLIPAVVFGAVAAVAHLLAFGIDPMRRKGMAGIDEFEADRVAKAVDKAEVLLQETISASHRIGDRRLEGRVESLASAARDMFRTVEQDPRVRSAYLDVLFREDREAALRKLRDGLARQPLDSVPSAYWPYAFLADLYARNRDAQARHDYEALLSDLERSFDAQHKTLLLDDRSDLDVEISVLRDRLKQEGLRAGEDTQ